MLKKPVLEGSKTLICTAFDASGSLNTAVRSIERAGAPANSVNAAIGVVTTGAKFCPEAVIARQKEIASARVFVIGDDLLNPRLGLGKSEPPRRLFDRTGGGRIPACARWVPTRPVTSRACH